MFKFIGDNAVTISICLSFFTFGFVLGADFFQLSSRQIIAALISGAVCGATILGIEYYRSQKQLNAVRERLAA
jgi:uncharacterized membrane protein YciS (DUF1049 family)